MSRALNRITVEPAYNEHSSVAAKSVHCKQVFIYKGCVCMKKTKAVSIKNVFIVGRCSIIRGVHSNRFDCMRFYFGPRFWKDLDTYFPDFQESTIFMHLVLGNPKMSIYCRFLRF